MQSCGNSMSILLPQTIPSFCFMRKNYTYPFVFLALAAVAPLHLQAAAEGEAETEVELVDAELAAARGSLTGVVLDDARHAVPGAVVYIRSLNLGVVSGTDGSFSLRGIPEGTYEVCVTYVGNKI